MNTATTTRATTLAQNDRAFAALATRLRWAERSGDWTEAGKTRALATALGIDEWALVRAARAHREAA